MAQDMMTTEEVADSLGIHPKQVYRLLKQGRLPGTHITGRWVFSRHLIIDWIEPPSGEARTHKQQQDPTVRGAEPHHLIIVGADVLLLQILQREFNRRHKALLVTSAAMKSATGISAVRDRRSWLFSGLLSRFLVGLPVSISETQPCRFPTRPSTALFTSKRVVS